MSWVDLSLNELNYVVLFCLQLVCEFEAVMCQVEEDYNGLECNQEKIPVPG